jgi:hypothetical protein
VPLPQVTAMQNKKSSVSHSRPAGQAPKGQALTVSLLRRQMPFWQVVSLGQIWP